MDGGEGGTGAAPLVFTDHVALPFKMAFGRVRRVLAEQGVLVVHKDPLGVDQVSPPLAV